MKWIVALFLAIAGGLIIGAVDQGAMDSCLERHSHDVCFYSIYR